MRIGLLTQKLEADPTNAVLYLERADLRREHGEITAAMADATQARKLRPDLAAAHLQVARVLFELKVFADAQAAAAAALKLEPDNADALVICSRCLVQSARTNEAIGDLTRVLARREAALPDLYLERARLQADMGDFAGAVKGLDEGIRKLGNTPSLTLPAIDYERRRGAYAPALERLASVQRYLPAESTRALRGEILAEAGRQLQAQSNSEISHSHKADQVLKLQDETD